MYHKVTRLKLGWIRIFVGTLQQDQQLAKFQTGSLEELTKSVSAYEDIMNRVITGEITLADFQLLHVHSENAVELCDISDTLQSRKNDLKLAFGRRKAEFQAYTTFITNFSEFWQLCKPYFKSNLQKYFTQ